MIRPLTTALAGLAVLTATPVLAQDEGWAFDFTAATDNRSKDASKSGGDPALMGDATRAFGSFYAGGGFETIKSGGSDLELEAFAGWSPEVMGFAVNLDVTHKWRVGSDTGVDDDAWEFTADVSRAVGPAEAGLRLQHSPDGAGSVKAWTWVEANLAWAFTDRLTGSAALGRREQDNAVDYTGWNAGVTWEVRDGLEADLRWHDTDAGDAGEQYDGALVASLSVAF